MKKHLLIASMLLSMQAISQPVITDGSHIATPGISVPVSFATTTSAGSAGASQTWDFSSLSFTSLGNIDVITPSTSPIGSSFPTANYALSLSGAGSYSFFKVSSTKMEVLAWTISTPGTGNDYSANPRTTLKFPFHYTDTETDTWQKVGGSTENVTLTYDGYGTLKTPTKTYSNVVRVKEDYGSGAVDYQWYILNPLMAIAIFDHNNNRLYHFGATPTNISENEMESVHVDVYPNPSSDVIKVRSKDLISNLEIYSVLGEKVYQTNVKSTNADIDLSSFSKGVYFIQLTTNGKIISRKIALQ